MQFFCGIKLSESKLGTPNHMGKKSARSIDETSGHTKHMMYRVRSDSIILSSTNYKKIIKKIKSALIQVHNIYLKMIKSTIICLIEKMKSR